MCFTCSSTLCGYASINHMLIEAYPQCVLEQVKHIPTVLVTYSHLQVITISS